MKWQSNDDMWKGEETSKINHRVVINDMTHSFCVDHHVDIYLDVSIFPSILTHKLMLV